MRLHESRRRFGPATTAAVLLILIAAGMVAVLIWSTAEPTWRGRSLTDWVQVYNRSDDTPPALEASEARLAMQVLATNRLPALVEALGYDPGPRRANVAAKARGLPPSIRRSRLMRWLLLDRRQFQASEAATILRALGPKAAPALPELARLSEGTNSLLVSHRAISVLARMDAIALPSLLAVITNRQHPNRIYALQCLSDLEKTALPAVPCLHALTEDPDPAIRIGVTSALSRIAPP